jgi:hypothetical protein
LAHITDNKKIARRVERNKPHFGHPGVVIQEPKWLEANEIETLAFAGSIERLLPLIA